MMTDARGFNAEDVERDKRKATQRTKSRQLSVSLALLMGSTALITAVVLIVVTTGKRLQGSEVVPFIGGGVVLALVFAGFLKLVNEEPALLFRTIWLLFSKLPLHGTLPPPPRLERKDAWERQLQHVLHARRQRELAAPTEDKTIDIERMIRGSLSRLEAEISEVRRRGGINLAMGMSITMLGLGILGYAVYAAPATQATPVELATYFLPRLSLAIVTEMFAYFFLRLYKLSMNETKYFQNELTGAEARALSILMASKLESPALLGSVAKSLAALDRNHVLEKGQTTVEIEQARIESDSFRGLAGAINRSRRFRVAKKADQGGV